MASPLPKAVVNTNIIPAIFLIPVCFIFFFICLIVPSLQNRAKNVMFVSANI